MESETSEAVPTSPEFTAGRGAFALLLLANGVLTLLTLGVYRFWARTKLRGFLWRNVRFLGDPLEYTGTAGELFLGFLIVLAVLFPLGALYGAIGVLVPPGWRGVGVGLEIAYCAALFVLLQIGFYRMWRYRMSRTLWRGVRFGLDGSSWQYLRLAIGWTILTLCTLGIAYPWMKVDLWRYQVQHTRFGGTAFDFDGSGRPLLAAWFAVLAPLLAVIGVVAYLGFLAGANFGRPQTLAAAIPETAVLAALACVAILPFTYLYFRVRQTRYCLGGVRFASARFASSFSFWRLLGSAALTSVGVIAVLIPAVVWLEVASRGAGDIGAMLETATLPFAVLVLTILLVAPWILGSVFGYDVARLLTTSTAVTGADEFETALQRPGDAPRFGEGLADALDIGGF